MPSLKLYLPGVPQSTERSPSETVTVALPTRTRTTRRRIPSRSRMAGRRRSGYPVDPLETRRELRWKLDWTVGRRNSWFVPSRVSLSLFSFFSSPTPLLRSDCFFFPISFLAHYQASSLSLPALSLPLRPIFLYNPSPSDPATIPSLPPPSVLGFHPVICVSASQYLSPSEERRRAGGWEYHQGAGDDHELWGKGLSPGEWWEWRKELLKLRRDELEEEVGRRLEDRKGGKGNVDGRLGGEKGTLGEGEEIKGKEATLILPTELVYLSTLPQPAQPSRPTISIYSYPSTPPSSPSPLHLILVQRPNKDGITPLLAEITKFTEPHLRAGTQVVIACEDGKDASVGVGVCILHLFFDEEGKMRKEGDAGESFFSFSSRRTRRASLIVQCFFFWGPCLRLSDEGQHPHAPSLDPQRATRSESVAVDVEEGKPFSDVFEVRSLGLIQDR